MTSKVFSPMSRDCPVQRSGRFLSCGTGRNACATEKPWTRRPDYGWIWTRPGSGFGVGVPGRQRDGRIDLARSLLTKRPVLIEPETKFPTLSVPTTFSVLIQCRALLMVQPHWEQSGVPPKTQGSTRLLRSAE